MKKKIFGYILKKFPVFVLGVVIFIVALVNWKSGTWLSGWDNLHPEFNFALNIKRSIFAVWQEYQGLGLLAGMAHASDFPRQLILWMASLILPKSFLRYFFHFFILFTGVLGIYKVIYECILREFSKPLRKKGAFLGALFYLLNLGTVQYFFLPYEPFSVFWGVFPWLICVLLFYIQSPNITNLGFLALVNFLASPIAYVQTIFYVYLLIVGLILAINLLSCKLKSKDAAIGSLITLFIIICVNAYWLLPNFYWVIANRKVTQDAIINKTTTEEKFILSKKFGTISNFALLKNKSWDYLDWNFGASKGIFLMKEWRNYFNDPFIPILGYLFFIIVLLGLFKKSKYRKYLLAIFAISAVSLLSNTFVISQINSLIRSVTIVYQVLRDPFTKFIAPTLFVFSAGFSLGSVQIIKIVNTTKKLLNAMIFTALSFFLIVYALPVFRGGLISKRVQTKIPQEYFLLFDYFKNKDRAERIVNLPQGNFWGWSNYSWGYTGSGFLWHGIEQPIMDRAFDVWSGKSENYYWELKYALERQNIELFNRVLDKYNISYILFDNNIIFPDNPNYYRIVESQLNLINHNENLFLDAEFGNLRVYKVNLKHEADQFVYLAQDLPEVNSYKWGNYDRAYVDLGNYISKAQSGEIIYYPFRSLFSGRGVKDLKVKIIDQGEYFVFKAQIPKDLVGGRLLFPAIEKEEISQREKSDVGKRQFRLPEIYLDGELMLLSNRKIELAYIKNGNFEVRVPKIKGYYSYDSSNLEGKPLGDIYLPNLKHKIGYLIGVKAENISGRPLKFWIENLTARRADQQVFLEKRSKAHWEYFIQPPMAEDGVGYTLHFDDKPIGNEKRVNKLGRITINPIPYKFLSRLTIVKNSKLKTQNSKTQVKSQNLIVKHPNPSLYYVSLNQNIQVSDQQNTILILSQAYDKGWRAYKILNSQFSILNSIKKWLPFVFGEPMGEHVLVNNWANGWEIKVTSEKEKGKSIVIVYLPQYLQHFGFLLLIITPLVVVKLGDGRV